MPECDREATGHLPGQRHHRDAGYARWLNKCQEGRVRAFLRNVLGPHEQEHARRLRTYNGTTTRPFSATACGRNAVNEAAQTKAQEMHQTESEKRAKDAEDLSLAIDPFVRPIDLDC